MTNKDQNTYISTYMKHKNIFQNRLKSYSEKIHFFSDQTLDIRGESKKMRLGQIQSYNKTFLFLI